MPLLIGHPCPYLVIPTYTIFGVIFTYFHSYFMSRYGKHILHKRKENVIPFSVHQWAVLLAYTYKKKGITLSSSSHG